MTEDARRLVIAGRTFELPPWAQPFNGDEQTSFCRSCDAPIVWVTTIHGKKAPINQSTDGAPSVNHFATCPQAATWKR